MNELPVPAWAALPAAILLVMGGTLTLIGAVGLVRLRDFFERLHPPAMGSSLGAGCVLIASMLVSSALLHRPVIHEILISVFIVLSAPITSMLLIRAAMARRKKHDATGNGGR
jgi:multicomponent K+:H+ antiporter subunit G